MSSLLCGACASPPGMEMRPGTPCSSVFVMIMACRDCGKRTEHYGPRCAQCNCGLEGLLTTAKGKS